MKLLKYFYALALVLSFGFAGNVNASSWENISGDAELLAPAQEVLIVIMGNGTARCGLSSQSSPVEFGATVREDQSYFKSDFRNLMNQAYSKLNISNKGTYPVLVVEPNELNSWRRVDMADIIMGENTSPWMYVIYQSTMIIYGHDNGSGSGITYHAENNETYIGPVVGGYPYELAYATRFNFHVPNINAAADSTFWTAVDCGWMDRKEVLENIILSGTHWQGVTASDLEAFKARIDMQRFSYDEFATVIANSPEQHTVWRSAKKIVADGILWDWDLAFTQSHFQSNGASYIRQWVF